MRDWPEPDQDTSLDILDTWDPGDYEEARAERYYEEIARAEEIEANTPDDDNPYADWEPPNTCACCDTEYCQSMAYDEYDDGSEYAQKMIAKNWEKFCITKLNVTAAHARSNILQAKANIARIKADIAEFKSQIAYNDYVSVEGPICYTDVENQLVNTETNLVEAKTVLADARKNASTIRAAQADVDAAQNYVKYAEAKVQIEKDAKNRTIEFVETFNSKFLDDDEDAIVEDEHIEFVNALMELAEAKDALDLAETLLANTSAFSLTYGYGFASDEPHCPTSSLWNDKLSSRNPAYYEF